MVVRTTREALEKQIADIEVQLGQTASPCSLLCEFRDGIDTAREEKLKYHFTLLAQVHHVCKISSSDGVTSSKIFGPATSAPVCE